MSEVKDKMDIKRFVGGFNRVWFEYYRQGYFYYNVKDLETGETFTFPIPIVDTGSASLNHDDKAITFMRWIRKAIDEKTLTQKL